MSDQAIQKVHRRAASLIDQRANDRGALSFTARAGPGAVTCAAGGRHGRVAFGA
jgi:hypothetical protein